MNATVEDLLATIGEQTVEIRMLRQQVNELGGKLATAEAALSKTLVEQEPFEGKESPNKKEK